MYIDEHTDTNCLSLKYHQFAKQIEQRADIYTRVYIHPFWLNFKSCCITKWLSE